jgi:hypothetical protein
MIAHKIRTYENLMASCRANKKQRRMRTLLVGIRKVKEFGSVSLHKFLSYRDFI